MDFDIDVEHELLQFPDNATTLEPTTETGLNPDIPDPHSWDFRAARLDIDLARILRESEQAGSNEVTVCVGQQKFYFIRSTVIEQALADGFRCTALMRVADLSLRWQGSDAVLLNSTGVVSPNNWYVTTRPILNLINKWRYRPLEVRVRGRA